jgi:co-chaperonin GroES (HSP10)
MKFRPLHDRIVVKRIDADEKTKGGIIIPDTAKEKPSQGEVRGGPGGRDEAGKLIPIDVEVGDRVPFGNGPAPRSRSMAKTPHHEERHHGRHRRGRRQEEGRLTFFRSPPEHTENSETHNGRQGSGFVDARDRMRAASRSQQCREGDTRPQGPQRRARQVVRAPRIT